MQKLGVGIKGREYPVYIGDGELAEVGKRLAAGQFAARYAIIADTNVAGLYGERLLAFLQEAGIKAQLFSFPAGEEGKNLQMMGELASRLVSAGFGRRDAIIGFGGGVSGDLAGFLAASYMRGVPFVQIPTSLLAQVDSSVGGKTGVDLPQGKNLLGAFYQPKAVYIDTALLKTLPKEEFIGGLAEVIKYSIIYDRDFFFFLKENREKILALDGEVVGRVIYRCLEIKAEVVAADEREGGLRRILNFGHTIGHAVEAASRYTTIHGCAVAIGMAAAARLAVAAGLLAAEEEQEIVSLLSRYHLPIEIPPPFDRNEIRSYLLADKKVENGKVFYVLPTTIGATTITSAITEAQLAQVLAVGGH